MNELERIAELELELKELKKKVKEEHKLTIGPRTRYIQQKCQADKRNIEWLFTFETWWKMWEESGKWEQRGRKAGQYCMARKGDIGPYSVENVDIVNIEKNSSDGNKGKVGPWRGKKLPQEMVEAMRIRATGVKQSDETRKKKSEANKGRPWSEARRAAHKQAWNKGLTKATDTRIAEYANNYPDERKPSTKTSTSNAH